MANTGDDIPAHFVRSTQVYLLTWSSLALAASIGALDRYASGPVSTRIFAALGTIICGILLLGFIVEFVMSRRERTDSAIWSCLNWMHRTNLPDRAVHVAIQLLSIISVSISAVNMHSEIWDWQFGFSATLVAMVLIYNVMYSQAVMVSIAMYNYLEPAVKNTLVEQYKATTFVWKKSYVDDRLMPSAI